MYPFVDIGNRFHVDHVFPTSMLTRAQLLGVGIPDTQVDDLEAKANRLPNLHPVEGQETTRSLPTCR